MKSDQIRSFLWSVFSHIRTEYGRLLRIHSEYRKIRTGKNSVFGHFSCSESLEYFSGYGGELASKSRLSFGRLANLESKITTTKNVFTKPYENIRY